jgi:hypothetical protein
MNLMMSLKSCFNESGLIVLPRQNKSVLRVLPRQNKSALRVLPRQNKSALRVLPRQNKTSLLWIALLASISQLSFAAVTVDYQNRDSKEYIFTAECSGSRSSITFRSGTTGAATLQGSAPCIVKTATAEVTLNGGEDVEIRNGEIKIL